MIKNKEQIKKEMKAEVSDIIEKYVDDMDDGSNGIKFPIDSIELMLENVIRESKKVIVDRTSELVNSIAEEQEIVKKTRI